MVLVDWRAQQDEPKVRGPLGTCNGMASYPMRALHACQCHLWPVVGEGLQATHAVAGIVRHCLVGFMANHQEKISSAY